VFVFISVFISVFFSRLLISDMDIPAVLDGDGGWNAVVNDSILAESTANNSILRMVFRYRYTIVSTLNF